MVTPDEALRIVLDTVATLPIERVPHDEALGRTLARDIISDLELPPFDNSAMDGFAVVAADTDGATPQKPVALRVLETIAAGAVPSHRVTCGTCSKIMTGATVPSGADAVVMREETEERGDGTVQIFATASAGQQVRRAGSDVARGETVLRAGTLVRAAEWGMLASLNQACIEVGRQPRVAIITTGDELVEVGGELQAGQIRDSNSFTLDGLARGCGALVPARHHVGDDPQTLERTLRECVAHGDAVVTSGGVSAGDFDPVRDVLQKIAHIHFWKIAMKPGKPVMFATLENETGPSVPVFGLPGNPVSVMVAFEQFVRPALLKMQGRRALRRIIVPARVDVAFTSPAGKTEFVRALVTPQGTGWQAHLAGEQSSGRLSTMTRSNALLIVPAEVTHIAAGQTLPAQMTDWPERED